MAFCKITMLGSDAGSFSWLGTAERKRALGNRSREIEGASHQIAWAAASTGGAMWQQGFHDHALRNEENILDIARYVVMNPVRAKLCKRVGDYPFWDAVWV